MFNLPDGFIRSFLKSQFTELPYPTHDFSGQTIIVTGSNVGLGLEASRHLTRLGASKLILACRSTEKGDAAKLDIEATTKTQGVVEVWKVDLESYASVKEFCDRVERLERLDAVIENAGIATPYYKEVEGMESTITVNVISTFLMALLLLPKLRESAVKFGIVPHLTIVSSEAHEQATFKEQSATSILEALKKPNNQPDRYNLSKLLEILTVRELAPAMDASGKPKVILNTLTPGFCHSDLMRNTRFPMNVLGYVGKRLIGRTSEMGSRTLVEAAKAGADTHGVFCTDCTPGQVSSWARSAKGVETQSRFYKELLAYLEVVEPGITKNI